MKTTFPSVLVLHIIVLMLASCSSPLDIETPREKTYEFVPVTNSRSDFTSIFTSTISYAFDATGIIARVGLNDNGSILSMSGKLLAPAGTESDMPLRVIDIKLDSVLLDGNDIVLNTLPANGNGATMDFYDRVLVLQTIETSPTQVVTLTLRHDKATQLIEGEMLIDVTTMSGPLMITGTISLEY